MSRNISYSTVPRAVEQALAQGYQLSPASVKLLVKLGEHRRIKKLSPEPTFEMIVREVIEVKVKRSVGCNKNYIEFADLMEIFPDVFESEVEIAKPITPPSPSILLRLRLLLPVPQGCPGASQI